MVDKLVFWCSETPVIKHLTRDFFNNRKGLFENYNNEYTFKLFNPDNQTKNYITVCSIGFGRFLLIKGSIRKWYLSENIIGDSLEDLTRQEFVKALTLIFSYLKISDNSRKFFKISAIEIGINILLDIPCSIITGSIYKYKNSWHKPTIPFQGCKKFSTKNSALSVYDKGLEILRHPKNKRKRKGRLKEKMKGKYCLRMEYPLRGGPKVIKENLKISTLEESVSWYDMFYIYYWYETQEIEIHAQNPIFNAKGKSPKEIMRFIKYWGVYILGEIEIERMAQESNDPKGTRTAIKRIYKYAPIENKSVNKFSLLEDVKKRLISLMTRSGCLHLEKGLVIEEK